METLVNANDTYTFVQDFLTKHWIRTYPLVSYVPFCGDDPTDAIWGDDIDESDDSDELWGDDLFEETTPEFEGSIPTPINLYITDRCGIWARRIGYEKADDAIMIAPVLSYQQVGIVPKRYDQIDTGLYTFTVLNVLPVGKWSNTDKYIYTSMNCRVM